MPEVHVAGLLFVTTAPFRAEGAKIAAGPGRDHADPHGGVGVARSVTPALLGGPLPLLLLAGQPAIARFGLGLGCIAIGVLLTRDALRSLGESVDRRRGPTAPGRIVSSRVQGPSGPDLDTWYLHVAYEYEVKGRRYSGTRIAPTHEAFTSWWSAMWRARKFEPGTHVRVYFDPAAPDRAILDPRLSTSRAWVLLVGGLGFAVTGLLELSGVSVLAGG